MGIRRRMIEDQRRLASQFCSVKRVIHHEEDVDVVRVRAFGDERPEYHEPCQMPGVAGHPVDSFQTLGNSRALSRTRTETIKHLPQRCRMHAER